MATNAYLTYHDGKLEVPEELQREWHLHEGARLRVIQEVDGKLRLQPDDIPDPKTVDWRQFEGVLSGLGLDLNADLEAERIKEELDARG